MNVEIDTELYSWLKAAGSVKLGKDAKFIVPDSPSHMEGIIPLSLPVPLAASLNELNPIISLIAASGSAGSYSESIVPVWS